jgi:type II secretory pathway pseudopilin PulG
MHRKTYKGRTNVFYGGFGLIELLVSISIMVLVTSVILARHDAFNGASLLRGQTYDLALTIREMQLLAVSAIKAGSGLDYDNVYGLSLDVNRPSNYDVFRDANDDYEFTDGEEFGQQGIMDRRFVIDRIELLGSGSDVGEYDDITILFERPNFDALLFRGGVAVDSGISTVLIDVRVRGTTGTGPGELRQIEVTRTGQITVRDI